MNATTANYTMDLASFAANFTSKTLPASLKKSLPIFLLDAMAAMLSGIVQPVFPASLQALTRIHGNGGNQTVKAVNGAHLPLFGTMYLNGIATGAFQLEHVVLNAHPSASVLPALLAYASTGNFTGDQFLTALAVGYEISSRIGLASTGTVETERGFHNPGINGQLAVAAAVGNLLGWKAELIASAMGVAASSSCGLVAFQSTNAQTKQLHPGHGGALGIEAAFIAEAGVRGPMNVLESPKGFLHAFSPEPNATALTDQLGERWDCEATTVKHYPMHSRFQTLVYGIQTYKNREPWGEKAIKDVTVYSGPRVLSESYQIPHPDTLDLAQYSTQFCIAAALLQDLSNPFVVNDTWVNNGAIQKLSGDIKFEQITNDTRSEGGYVIVTLSDNTVLNISAPVESYIGRNSHPDFLQGMEDKFDRIAASLGVKDEGERLHKIVVDLWEEETIAPVYQALVDVGSKAKLVN